MLGKGKARAPYEFGCKVSLATPVTQPKGGQFVLQHARALHGNPFDGHTLRAAIAPSRRSAASRSSASTSTRAIVNRHGSGTPNRHSKGALTQFRCRSRGVSFSGEQSARRRSSLARPCIWRLTSLSLVIWPSVCPLDQGSTSAAATALSSACSPFAKDAKRGRGDVAPGPPSADACLD